MKGGSRVMSETYGNESITNQTIDVITRLNRWAQSAMLQDQIKGELSLRQLTALYIIEHEPTTPGQLARRLMVTPAVVTGLIDRLERRGFVRRESESEDRRRIHLELTEEGRAAGASVRRELARYFSSALGGLSDDEQERLSAGLDVLLKVICDLESRGFQPKPATDSLL
jgi:DNA-binding MarR family transcriptional regulator